MTFTDAESESAMTAADYIDRATESFRQMADAARQITATCQDIKRMGEEINPPRHATGRQRGPYRLTAT